MSGEDVQPPAQPADCEIAVSLSTPNFDNFAFLGTAKEARVGDILYSYHRFGKAGSSRPALVLIQGMGATQYGWPATMLEDIAKTREVVIFDNILAGLTVDTKAGERPLELTVPLMARSCLDLIADLKLGTVPDVLGISMGGMVALWLAAHHGSAVGSIVATATSYGKGAPEPEGGIDAMLDHLSSAEALTDVSLLLPEGEKDPGFAALGLHIASLQYAAIPGFGGLPDAGYATAEGIIPPSEVAEGDRHVPRCILLGTHDKIFPAATSAKAATATPGSWLVNIEGSGHAPFLRDPRAFTQHVLRFLDASKAEDKQTRLALEAAAPPGCFAGLWRWGRH
ncbi:hypothetical protein ABPG77_005923 [Micractinium sp. CCAP 211/92]